MKKMKGLTIERRKEIAIAILTEEDKFNEKCIELPVDLCEGMSQYFDVELMHIAMMVLGLEKYTGCDGVLEAWSRFSPKDFVRVVTSKSFYKKHREQQ